MPPILAFATCDTKGEELAYLAARIRAAGGTVTTVDVGTQRPPSVAVDVPRTALLATLAAAGEDADLSGLDRGQAVEQMSRAVAVWLGLEQNAGRVAGVIGLGGSGGTVLLAPAFRRLPVGIPKLIVSTVAAGNTAPYVDVSDLVLLPSVVDVAGLNAVSRPILANAAAAIVGMVRDGAATLPRAESGLAVGMTMFGVTTPCVTAVRQALEARGCDCLVFHATGTGGRAMEALADGGLLAALVDLTTTEVADHLVGGVFPCGPDRFGALERRALPAVVGTGALDMVNFGAIDTVPERFRGRRLHVHNPQVTLMRTTPEENVAAARFIAARLGRAAGPLEILLPARG
ncbi:MAG: Tm-1-like ATP-binding domain-containing protein, partial [Planctomycetes bacterium]|nr:Tm-1-like ATP-binding domain-containing protein [Planctomycetota bacterium]